MNATTGELYLVAVSSVRLHSSPKTHSWYTSSNSYEPDVVWPHTLFLIVGNAKSEKDHHWVCILTSDCKMGWVNRTLFNDRVSYFKKVA